jgi:pimeloyl-ACP methyl ester carboxylesterase
MTVHHTPLGPIEMLSPGDTQTGLRAVLLHAAASGPRALFKLAAGLGATGWQTGLPALHGYGATMLRDVTPIAPFAAHVRVARWALDHIPAESKPERRVLIGHSMGGTIALLAALDGASIDALVLYEPILLDCLDPADPVDIAARAWDGACIQTLHEKFAAGDPEAGVAAFVEAYNEVAWTQLPRALRAELVAKATNLVAETNAAQDLRLNKPKLAALPMPVLILQGSRSPQVTHRMTVGLARAIPHALRTVIDGAGHMGPVMSHVAVASVVSVFLRNLPKQTSPAPPP